MVIENIEATVPRVTFPIEIYADVSVDRTITASRQLPDGWELELEFVALAMESSEGEHKLLYYDSTKSADQWIGSFEPLCREIGQRLHYLTDTNGKVEKITDYDKFLRVVAGDDSKTARLGKWMTEDSLKKIFDLTSDLPDHPVNFGDWWKVKTQFSVGQLAGVEMDLDFTFRRLEQYKNINCARLDFSGTCSAFEMEISGVKFSFENSDVSGTEWFDPARGMLVEKAFNVNLHGQIVVAGQSAKAILHLTANIQMQKF